MVMRENQTRSKQKKMEGEHGVTTAFHNTPHLLASIHGGT